MRIVLIGAGKLARAIAFHAESKGHEIIAMLGREGMANLAEYIPLADVAIEVSVPTVAADNILQCIKGGLPVVSGTTGWLSRKIEVDTYCLKNNGAFFYASNFSLGVALFQKIARYAAQQFAAFPQYSFSIEEIHHTHKLDVPSGTAITLSETLLKELPQYTAAKLEESSPSVLTISSKREGEVKGTHSIHIDSEIDSIILTHDAHNRDGFALGALHAAEWIIQRKGVFGMEDLLQDLTFQY